MTSKLAEYIVKDAIILDADVSSAEEIIRALSKNLMAAGYVRSTFADAAMSRERSIPTGLPLGGTINAAIPHTDIEHVLKAGVGMATLRKPVIFQNMISPEESVEVRLVFILALDQPKSQIEMLQEVAGVIQDPQLVMDLVNAKTIDEVMTALKG
ncbi:MAG: PTS sugar transporter subunit IIA [Chloroflexota bacterium]